MLRCVLAYLLCTRKTQKLVLVGPVLCLFRGRGVADAGQEIRKSKLILNWLAETAVRPLPLCAARLDGAPTSNGLIQAWITIDMPLAHRASFPCIFRNSAAFSEKESAMAKKKKAKRAAAKAMTRSEFFMALAESNGFSKKEIAGLFDEITVLIKKNLGKRGPGIVTIPGLMKIKVVRKPATKARKGINPFTGEETVFKAKPARNAVKITAMKGLKDMV